MRPNPLIRATRPLARLLCAAVALLGCAGAAEAEIFVLQSGGQVTGKWLNREVESRETYVIQPELGGQLTLDENLVQRIIEPSPDQRLYEKLGPAVPDTVEGHWKMAEWCRERMLLDERHSHLRRVIELDPEHEEAHLALGYRRVRGRWMTQEEQNVARGLVLYRGQYRTRQEIQLIERAEKSYLAEREWHGKIKRWHGWLNDADKAFQAKKNFRGVRDPFAVGPLARLLNEEKRPAVKILLIETLAQIDSSGVVGPLVRTSLNDPVEEIRLTCLDHLTEMQSPLALKMYIAELGDKSNQTVNRAAEALRVLGNPEAIAPLIDALVTTHKYKIVVGKPGQMSSTFGSGGGGGFSFGGAPPRIIERRLPNPEVLGALVALSGKNFQYDIAAWKQWHAHQKNSLRSDARRD
jgi:hypothetical protein